MSQSTGHPQQPASSLERCVLRLLDCVLSLLSCGCDGQAAQLAESSATYAHGVKADTQ